MDTWERESPCVHNEPTKTSNLGAVLGGRSSNQNSDLPNAEAPPLVSRNLELPKDNSPPPEKNVPGRKHNFSSIMPEVEVSNPPKTGSKTIRWVRSRGVVIFGTLSFAVGVGFGAILFSKSNWNLSNLRPTYESIAAHFANGAQTTPLAISAPDISVSQTANQLRSIGTELNSLRQDMRSLAGELAQIREAQEHLTAAQAELVRKSQSTSEVRDNRGEAAQAELVRKRPDSRTNRGKRSTASPPHP